MARPPQTSSRSVHKAATDISNSQFLDSKGPFNSNFETLCNTPVLESFIDCNLTAFGNEAGPRHTSSSSIRASGDRLIQTRWLAVHYIRRRSRPDTRLRAKDHETVYCRSATSGFGFNGESQHSSVRKLTRRRCGNRCHTDEKVPRSSTVANSTPGFIRDHRPDSLGKYSQLRPKRVRHIAPILVQNCPGIGTRLGKQ